MYEIILTEKSCCPCCDKPVHMLYERSGEDPRFYICFACSFVSQIGVGPVTPLPDPRILEGLKFVAAVPVNISAMKSPLLPVENGGLEDDGQ